MYKLIAFAVLAFFFMFCMLYFHPTIKISNKNVINEETPKSSEENNTLDIQTEEPLVLSNTNDKKSVKFETMSAPRNNALSHQMDEKYFLYYDVRSYEEMHMNLQERLDSLAEAKIKSEKGKQIYDENL